MVAIINLFDSVGCSSNPQLFLLYNLVKGGQLLGILDHLFNLSNCSISLNSWPYMMDTERGNPQIRNYYYHYYCKVTKFQRPVKYYVSITLA